jgi:uncharacterized protein YegL
MDGALRGITARISFKIFIMIVVVACFMPFVAGSPRAAHAADPAALDVSQIPQTSESEQASGLYLGKNAQMDATGRKATVTLDAYAGGSVTAKLTSMPTDIVLLLDVSGTMFQKMNDGTSRTRVEALQEAVNNYIDLVYQDAIAKNMTHKLSIITYSGNPHKGTSESSVLVSNMSIDSSTTEGKIRVVKSHVSQLEYGWSHGATMTGVALGDAYNELQSEYQGDSNNHIVVLFTDGAPGVNENWIAAHCSEPGARQYLDGGGILSNIFGGSSCSSTTEHGDSFAEANLAISNSQKIKDAGASVYVVGLGFDVDLTSSRWIHEEYLGADAKEFYNNLYSKDSVKSDNIFLADSQAAGDHRVDVETQRFLEYVSSNVNGATAITQEATNLKNGYAFSANSEEDLIKTFESIEPVGTPAIDLDATGELRDYVTSDWTAPDFKTAVKVYQQDYLGYGDWGTPKEITSEVSIIPSGDGSGFTVTGFDYKANFVSDTPRLENGNSTFGSRLIAQFSMDADSCFEGGKNVPTNTQVSAMYRTSSSASIGDFPIPHVDVAAGEGCLPCDLSGSSVPKSTDADPENGCAAMNDTSIRDGAAYEYAVIGGGDKGTDGNGYKGLLNTTALQEFVTDNSGATLKWEFSARDSDGQMRNVGSYTVSGGSTNAGTWSWQPQAEEYLQGIGTHLVSVSLTSTNHTGKVREWTAQVDVYVPAVTVVDSDIKLGHENPLEANMLSGYVLSESAGVTHGALATGDNEVYWEKRDSTKQTAANDLNSETNMLTSEPFASPVASFLEGDDPGKELTSADVVKPGSSTTFQVGFRLTAADGKLGPLAHDAPTEIAPSGISSVIDGETISAVYNVRDSIELNSGTSRLGYVIGAPLKTAEKQDVAAPEKAAFTIYVIGKGLSSLPLSGGSGVGKNAVLIGISTLIFAGLLAAATRSKNKSEEV